MKGFVHTMVLMMMMFMTLGVTSAKKVFLHLVVHAYCITTLGNVEEPESNHSDLSWMYTYK